MKPEIFELHLNDHDTLTKIGYAYINGIKQSRYIYELLTGMSKFDLQDDFVAGSSTATFTVIIYLLMVE